MEVEEEVMPIRGGGTSKSAAQLSPAGSILFYVDDMDLMGYIGTGLPLLPHSSPPFGLGSTCARKWHIPRVLPYFQSISPLS